jgi:excisionase family DNA binding protein
MSKELEHPGLEPPRRAARGKAGVTFHFFSRIGGAVMALVPAKTVPSQSRRSPKVEHHSQCYEVFMDEISVPLRSTINELPIRVREAAVFLGVSPQTVYLWVERKQIPHLRVMGRNIRFLKSELEPFRAQFKQEIGNGKTE